MKNRPVMMADIAAECKQEQDWMEGFLDASAHYQKAYGARKALRMIVVYMRMQRDAQGENVVQLDLSREFALLWQIYRDNQHKATSLYKILINV